MYSLPESSWTVGNLKSIYRIDILLETRYQGEMNYVAHNYPQNASVLCFEMISRIIYIIQNVIIVIMNRFTILRDNEHKILDEFDGNSKQVPFIGKLHFF